MIDHGQQVTCSDAFVWCGVLLWLFFFEVDLEH